MTVLPVDQLPRLDGEVDNTIDGQTMRRKPGDFWVVRPGQKYSIKNLGGMVVLHATIFTRK